LEEEEDETMRLGSGVRYALVTLAVTGFWSTRPVAATDMSTVTGEVIDMACYLPHPATGAGPGHKKCAETCVKKGLPMGLLTDDKQVFLLLEDHDNPKPYASLKEKAATKVTVEGEKVSQGGTQGLVVETVK
jgi:hypothetical protein